jgi:hypothetical protein
MFMSIELKEEREMYVASPQTAHPPGRELYRAGRWRDREARARLAALAPPLLRLRPGRSAMRSSQSRRLLARYRPVPVATIAITIELTVSTRL